LKTECTENRCRFQRLGSREVVADFEGGTVSSDGGGMLLRQVEEKFEIIRQFADCFTDRRDPARTEHSVKELLAQRIFGLCLGYEDLNDHERLRSDPLLAMMVGKEDPTGDDRARDRDRGTPLAGKSTLNRLELGSRAREGADRRYEKIAPEPERMGAFFVETFLQVAEEPEGQIVLDLDASDDPLHGDQLGKFFHGYYDHYCFFPLFIFCGTHLLTARLRRSNIGDAEGAVDELKRIVPLIRRRWPDVRIVVRGDSGFSTDELMSWCESHGLRYVFGMARNCRLEAEVAPQMGDAQAAYEETALPTRFYRDFSYRTRESWSRRRRMVGKAEYLPRGPNSRFVVTNIPASEVGARAVYEKRYCGRGRMENRIKEHQTQLFSTRTSTHWMESNQLRLWFSSVAYTLMDLLRTYGLKDTEMESAEPATLRTRLLKIGARVKVSVRRVLVSLASGFPLAGLFRQAYSNLRDLSSPHLRPDPAPI